MFDFAKSILKHQLVAFDFSFQCLKGTGWLNKLTENFLLESQGSFINVKILMYHPVILDLLQGFFLFSQIISQIILGNVNSKLQKNEQISFCYTGKQTLPYKSSAKEVSFESSQSRILSADSDSRIHYMLQHLIQGVEAKGVKWNR